MQDEKIRGGVGRRVKEPTGLTKNTQERGDQQNKIRENNAEFIEKFMEFGRSRGKNKHDALDSPTDN